LSKVRYNVYIRIEGHTRIINIDKLIYINQLNKLINWTNNGGEKNYGNIKN